MSLVTSAISLSIIDKLLGSVVTEMAIDMDEWPMVAMRITCYAMMAAATHSFFRDSELSFKSLLKLPSIKGSRRRTTADENHPMETSSNKGDLNARNDD